MTMPTPLFNPETAWHAEKGIDTVDMNAVFKRIGGVSEQITPLSGGLANENLRIGHDKVLRIYKRDVTALSRECELLSRSWKQFRVPKVLDRGDDFLVLEYVNLSPLENSKRSGEVVGIALAEIHQKTFDSGGLFGEGIAVDEPWPDFVDVIQRFIRACHDQSSKHAALLSKVIDFVSSRSQQYMESCQTAVLLHGDFKASNLHCADDGGLVILDWEFTYAGPAVMDIGQLFRWGQQDPFGVGFAEGYEAGGGRLAVDWKQQISWFDLANMVGLLTKSEPGSKREADCAQRIRSVCNC